MSSIPLSGKRFFFFVEINFYNLFLYAYILYDDKKHSKVLGSLQGLPSGFDLMYRALADRNMQV